ncbi:MAG: hypothetical protein HXX17_11010 [Geobacteraceae bacterium]|nr:hypothetical protein [Geobacteraceae bacterium]
MIFRFAIILFVTLVLTSELNAAQPLKARVPGGIGLLLLQPDHKELAIYREPHLSRIADKPVTSLPQLQFITATSPQVPIIVTSRKPGFYRIVYDDAEREGWIETGKSGEQFLRWADLLTGRKVSLITGLRKEYYTLKNSPTPAAATVAPIEKGKPVAVISVEGNWMQVITEANTSGWIRWQDENGRLVIGFAI